MLVQPQQTATVCELDLVQHAIRSWKGPRPWIRNNGRRTVHEPLNLTLDVEHAHVNGHCGKPADGSANETASARAACVRAGCDNRAMQDDIPRPPIYQRQHSNGYARSKADRVRANASVRPFTRDRSGSPILCKLMTS